MKIKNGITLLGFTSFLLTLLLCGSDAGAAATDDATHGILAGMHMQWGGYTRVIGRWTHIDDDTLYAMADEGPYSDGQGEVRLKNQLDIGAQWSIETHYELVASKGDTRKASQNLLAGLSGSPATRLFLDRPIDDASRLMDLTHTLVENDDAIVYHRLDRLNLTWTPDWGTVRLGRQALTWGDGLIFNPMDLFNPFAPTAVQRDYKTGDDMALVQLPVGQSDAQLLYLPRRDPLTGNVEGDQSSCAGLYHTFIGSLEASAMAASHFDDNIVAAGVSGYLKETAWRINTVYTHLAEENGQDNFFQVVANIDYAWMWGGKNVYGLMEFYYNGLGTTGDYQQALENEPLMDRLSRGEMFTLGRYYLAGQIQVELHPLVQFYTTAILNLSDPSGLLQPQVLWDVATDLQLIVGGQWHWGKEDTEFGGLMSTWTAPLFPSPPMIRSMYG